MKLLRCCLAYYLYLHFNQYFSSSLSSLLLCDVTDRWSHGTQHVLKKITRFSQVLNTSGNIWDWSWWNADKKIKQPFLALASLKSPGFSPLSVRRKVMNNTDMVSTTCHTMRLFSPSPNICSNRDLFFCSNVFDFIFKTRFEFMSVNMDKKHHPAH